jgi:hypothetical protein
MCMVDDVDRVLVLGAVIYVAKKEHKCGECTRVIRSGEKYLRERFVFDGEPSTHRTCSHCQVVRHWLSGECGGWVYGAIEEDIREHAEGGYGLPVIKLAVGMRRNWTTRKGALMTVPTLPVVPRGV